MDFTLPEELRMLRETVARFVREEILEAEALPSVMRKVIAIVAKPDHSNRVKK